MDTERTVSGLRSWNKRARNKMAPEVYTVDPCHTGTSLLRPRFFRPDEKPVQFHSVDTTTPFMDHPLNTANSNILKSQPVQFFLDFSIINILCTD